MGNMTANYAFLSYAKEDFGQIRRLVTRLREIGFAVWLDEHNLLAGQDWDAVIRRAIRESSVFILCLSEQAVTKSGYIQREIKEALDVTQSLPEGKVFILPIRLSECRVPDQLRRWHSIDIFKRGGYGRLTKALASHLGTPPETSRIPQPVFASASDHLLYELCLQAGRLIYGKVDGKRRLISQGHFLVTHSDFSGPFKSLRARLADVRELPASSIKKILPEGSPWRNENNLVGSFRFVSSSKTVALESRSLTVYVNAEYWRLALMVIKQPRIYVTKPIGEVYIEGADKGTIVVVMPLRMGAEEE